MFPAAAFPDILIGLAQPDDSAVYRVSDDLALVFTTDFFAPVVDDAYDYGAIAAANAMSDVYAMGGEVLMALNIAAFPPELDEETVGAILRGGADKVLEAGGAIVGGHTIDDQEPKYGLAVVGRVHPQLVARKQGARVGDALVLTKALGTGIITTANKAGLAEAEHVRGAVASMLQLNRAAAQIMISGSFNSATDITGFSLLGHATEMANAGDVTLEFFLDRIPFLAGSHQYAADWLFPGGTKRNMTAFSGGVQLRGDIPETVLRLLYTPETSGGLLISLPPGRLPGFLQACQAAGQTAWHIGGVAPRRDSWRIAINSHEH